MTEPTSIADKIKAEGRYFRRIIRKDRFESLTRSEREILVALFNLWVHHRNGPKGYIHPSRAVIARKCKCSVATVKRALVKFRAIGFLRPLSSNLRAGQGQANRYKMDLDRVQAAFDPSNVIVLPGRLEPVNDPQNDPLNPGQNDPLSYDGETVVSLKAGGRRQ